MSIIKKITMLLAIMMISIITFAQDKKVEMADKMRITGEFML